MAFQFTYREIFNKKGVARGWVPSSKQDAVLRHVVLFGLISAYVTAALLAGVFPPNNEFLAPHAFALPVILILAIWLYFLAWVADEYPVQSRRLLVISGWLFVIVYAGVVVLYQPASYVTRIAFLGYLIAVALIATIQFLGIRRKLGNDAA